MGFLASQERVERRMRTHALCGRHQRRDKVRTADLTDRWTDVKAGCLCPVCWICSTVLYGATSFRLTSRVMWESPRFVTQRPVFHALDSQVMTPAAPWSGDAIPPA